MSNRRRNVEKIESPGQSKSPWYRSGQPAAVSRSSSTRLLERLTAAGCPLRYHGDFDWPGLSIFSTLRRRLDISAWRFGADDYRAALGDGRGGIPLVGRPMESSWDAALAPAMAEAGVAVFEEQVIDRLLEDL